MKPKSVIEPFELESVIEPFLQNSYLGVVKAAEKLRPDLGVLLKDLNAKQSVFSRLCDWVTPYRSSFPCLCHGDARTANMFITTAADCENNQESNIMKLIDFQMIRYASPLTDLQYALQLGTTKEFRKKHLNQLLKEYHDEFQNILSRFPNVKLLKPNVEKWNFEKLVEEYNDFNLFGLLIATTFLPVVFYSGNSENKNVDEMDPNERNNFIKNERQAFVAQSILSDTELASRIFEACDEMKENNAI